MGFRELTGDSNVYRKVFELDGKQEEVLVGIYVALHLAKIWALSAQS